MAKRGSVAPKERVNIVYKPAVDAEEEVELPLKILSLGDFTGREDDRPLEDRKPINIDKDNFNEVMAKHDLNLELSVPDKLGDDDEAELSVDLQFRSMADFTPEGILKQVPELQKLMELREALTALKSPLGNKPSFRKRLQALLQDDEGRAKLMRELGLEGDGEE